MKVPDEGVVAGVVRPDDEHHGVGLLVLQPHQRVVLVPHHLGQVDVVRMPRL